MSLKNKTLLLLLGLFMLSSCTFNYEEYDLVGTWEVTYCAVTQKGLSSSEIKKVRALVTGNTYTFNANHTFIETRKRNYNNEGHWEFNETTQSLTLTYDFGNVRRMRFGIRVESSDEMKWSFTDSQQGGSILTLEKQSDEKLRRNQ